MRDQNVNLRFRDGSIYQAFPTDTTGFVPFDEVFPFFSWLVAEVDFARFKTTGVTVTVDAGGPVAPGEKLTPQIQADGVSTTRTETGPAVLLEAFQSFLGTTNQFEWGKTNYLPSENGGISGIVHYSTTRAEDDPAFAGAEPWEPGIPRVPVFLYRKDTAPVPSDPSKILTVNGVPGIQLSDVDHYPFGWRDGGPMGPEDVKRNGTVGTISLPLPVTLPLPVGFVTGSQFLTGSQIDLIDPALRSTLIFNAGDAVQALATDSWDDSLPTDCPGIPTDPFHQGGKCYDGLRNFNQVRPGVFDGGYAFTTYYPNGRPTPAVVTPAVIPSGAYIVEGVLPKGYEHQSEESKNVDFGDAPTVSPLALPQACVGNLHTVPTELTLFPGVAAPSAGLDRPLCDRKEVLLSSGQNAAADFFAYTDVPLAAQVKGFILNDLANEFNPLSPNFSEKAGVSWIPISFKDWTGREVVRVYSDQFGSYNAMVPSTYTINAPTPSGVAPHMMQICLNSPGPITNAAGQLMMDPFYNKHYGQVCWTLHMEVGKTLYADTPILPVAAFVGPGNVQTDCDCADKTPKIFSVTAAGNAGNVGGPYIDDPSSGTRTLTITSLGTVQVPDPNAIRTEGNLGITIPRDFGFGGGAGEVPGQVTLGGLPLPIVSWSNATITATVPATAQTGQLVVKRAVSAGDLDIGLSTTNSVTVTVGAPVLPNIVRTVAQGQSIQAALNAAVAGDLILVQPGTYYEMLIMTKPVKLQGFGAGSTHIIASQSQATLLQTWRENMNVLVNCPAPLGGQITLLPGQTNNTAVGPGGTGTCDFVPGTGLFQVDEGAGIFVATRDGVFNSLNPGRIDGFSIAGSATSPGIVVNGYARFIEISNNQVANNQGTYGGGIRVGDPTITASAQNQNASIHHNHIVQNGSQFAPGAGVALYTGSDNYRLTDNYVCGNFATEDGGGVAHYGLSPNGLIAGNKIVFNQTFVQAVGGLGGSGAGGGLLVAGVQPVVGDPIQISEGTGSVTITANLIQGNSAGTGSGAGVLLRSINGRDVLVSPANNSTWYHVELFNNIIVNNVAGLSGGGIAMQDAAKVTMINNTVAHNDSTATAGLAFTAGVPNVSNPQPAGIVSSRHSSGLCQAFQQAANCARYSDPVMENNIVLNNRSMFWEVNTQLPQPVGQLKTSGVEDLAVLPAGSGFLLHPMNGILTDSTTGYDASNLLVLDSASVLANPYFNAPPGFSTVQPDGTIVQLEFTTTLATAAALDEGGNFIDVHYGPLTPGGNYHLAAQSPAIDAGNDAALTVSGLLAADYDGQLRPTDGNNDGIVRTDIGADEMSGAAGNLAPVINSTPITAATALQLYAYQVMAADPNAGDLLSYSLTTFPAGMTVSAAGLVQWTPTALQAGTHAVTVRVQDQGGLFATQTYNVTVAPPQPAVVSFTLRDANDNVVIGPLTNGAIIDRLDLCGNCQVNMQANVTLPESVQSVRFTLSGATNPQPVIDNSPNYSLPSGGTNANFAGITLNPGPHTLTATPYSLDGALGTAGIPLTVNFTVAGPPAITSIPVPTATIGNLYTYDVEATTLTTPPLTYSFTQGPPANGTRGVMTIDSNTGVVSWTPAIPNPNTPLPYNTTVTVRATDALGRFTNQQFTIVVSSKPETIAVTQALFRNPPGPIGSPNSDASWTINGTSTVTAGSCTGTPNVCGTLTIYRVRLGVQAIIGTTTVQPDGTWFFAELPATPLAASGDTIRARSLTGGVSNDLLVTIQLN
jgi:hypothetical protein